jgi:UDP-N-acetylglucosamine 2-epimerase (non-hydrolysing)
MIVMGTRPEVMKLAPVALELGRFPARFRVEMVGTGQHRDLLPQHLALFRIRLHHDLQVMKDRQTLADIAARTLQRMHALLSRTSPDVVVVEGDTSAAFAAGLASCYHQIPIAHVEAGLRSGDPFNPFPEETNRRLLGGLADIHFAPTPGARDNLLRENVPPERIYVTGNTAIDALLLAARRRPQRSAVRADSLRRRRLLLVTAHRRESWDQGLAEICLALGDLVDRFPDVMVVYAVHPNPTVRRVAEKLLAGRERILLIAPPDYVSFVALMKRSYLILTDSGGIQEEAPSLSKPVLVMRKTTERMEGIEAGCAELVGVKRVGIVASASRLLTDQARYAAMTRVSNPYGDGRAAVRIRRGLAHYFGLARRRPADFGADKADKHG